VLVPGAAVTRRSRRRPWWRSRWWTPGVSLLLGAVVLAAFAVGGDPGSGLRSFAVFAVLAAVFALGTGSETLQGLGGPGRDERWSMIDLRASAFSGLVVITVLIGAWLAELAQGEDGSPYGQVMAVGGVAYGLAVAVLRRRS
jgi:hypothetical protein